MAKKTHPKVEAIAHRIMSEYLLHPDPKINSWITFDKALKLAQSAFVLVQFEPDGPFTMPHKFFVLKFTKREDAINFIGMMGECRSREMVQIDNFTHGLSILKNQTVHLSLRDAPHFGDVIVSTSVSDAMRNIDQIILPKSYIPESIKRQFWDNNRSITLMNASETKMHLDEIRVENERFYKEYVEYDEWLDQKKLEEEAIAEQEEARREWEEAQILGQYEWERDNPPEDEEEYELRRSNTLYEEILSSQKTELESFMKGIA